MRLWQDFKPSGTGLLRQHMTNAYEAGVVLAELALHMHHPQGPEAGAH